MNKQIVFFKKKRNHRLIRFNNMELANCVVCGREFFRRKTTRKTNRRSAIRPVGCMTCSKLCSQLYNRR